MKYKVILKGEFIINAKDLSDADDQLNDWYLELLRQSSIDDYSFTPSINKV